MTLEEASAAGTLAFTQGICSTPVMNKPFINKMFEESGTSARTVVQLLRAYTRAWHTANAAAVVPAQQLGA